MFFLYFPFIPIVPCLPIFLVRVSLGLFLGLTLDVDLKPGSGACDSVAWQLSEEMPPFQKQHVLHCYFNVSA